MKIVIVSVFLILFSCQMKTKNKVTADSLVVKQNFNTDIKKSENYLAGTLWITDSILGLNPKKKRYKLTKFIARKFSGNLTEFEDDLKFTSKYVSPCGNDYFTTVVGIYRFVDTNKIELIVSTVAYSGEWKKPIEHREPIKLVYSIHKSENELSLIKEEP